MLFFGENYFGEISRRGTVGAAACPARWNFIRRNGVAQRLPLEGKLAQLELRLMRSKLKIIAMSWYKIAPFDLIRSGLGRTTVVVV